MNDISEESLQLMAEQNEKFNTRFEQNNEQEGDFYGTKGKHQYKKKNELCS